MGLDISHSIPTLKTSADELLDYFDIIDLSSYPDYLQRHMHLLTETESGISEHDDDHRTQKVLFVRDIGYQRKGMNSRFYKDFQNGILYLHLEDVQKAYQYLEGDHINTLEELQKNFQKNFIDNFVEGESIFWINW